MLLRRLAILIVCLAVVLSYVPGTLAAEPTTITFAAIKTFGTDTATELIKNFEKSNPDIKVNYIELPAPSNSAEVHQRLVTWLAAHSSDVDVFTSDVIWFPEFANAGWLLNMDPYFTPAEKAQYFRGAIEHVTYNGHMYGVPWYIDGGFLYYRKDLLAKYGFKNPPKTWQELIHQAQVILAGERKQNPKLQGFVWQAKQAEVLVCDLVEFLGNDGKVLDGNKVEINNEDGLRAAQLMHDLIYKYKVSPVSVTTYDEEPSRLVFTSGNAIFLRNWSYVWGLAQDPAQSKVVGKVGIEPVPHFDGSGSASTMGGYQWAVNAYTKHKDAAVRFVKYLTSPQVQEYFAVKMGFAPTRPAVYSSPAIAKAQPFLPRLRDIFVNAMPRPITPYYPQVSLVLQSEFSSMLADRKSPEQAVNDAAKQIREIVAKK